MAVDARIEQLRAFREALATDLTAWQASQRTVTCEGLCGIAPSSSCTSGTPGDAGSDAVFGFVKRMVAR